MRIESTLGNRSGWAMPSARSLVTGAVPTVLLAVLLVAAPGAAQPGIDIKTTPAPPSRPGPDSRPQQDEPVRPATPDGKPRPGTGPFFIGPTVETETGRYGMSLWTAPNPPVGGAQTGWREVPGYAVFGFSYTWGGPQAP
jgi:hypothetical protein